MLKFTETVSPGTFVTLNLPSNDVHVPLETTGYVFFADGNGIAITREKGPNFEYYPWTSIRSLVARVPNQYFETVRRYTTGETEGR